MSTMNLAKRLTDELSAEMVICRQIFERLPTNLLDWKPHQKSPSAGSLAVHIADMVEWIGLAATTDELDYLVTPHNDFIPQSQAELLDYFDERTNGAIAALSKLSDQKMHEFWTVPYFLFKATDRRDTSRLSKSHNSSSWATHGLFSAQGHSSSRRVWPKWRGIGQAC
jgi:hypothetical protein